MIGNRFDRVFLRFFRKPTKKTVELCDSDSVSEPTRYTILRNGSSYIIDVFIRAQPHCPTVWLWYNYSDHRHGHLKPLKSPA